MNEIVELRSILSDIDKLSNDYWMDELENRKLKELEFHDKHRDSSIIENLNKDTYKQLYGYKKYYAVTQASKDYVSNWLNKEAKDHVFLDYCCGNGGSTIRVAKAGAKLAIGIDLSRVSINNARNSAAKMGVSENTFFVQADAENTKLPENIIDRAICSGVLHHLDLSKALPEIHRILRPGGKALVHEALDYNPAIKLYRNLTPQMRTEWEKSHILSMKDVKYIKKFFEVREIRFWHILSIMQPHLPFLGNVFQKMDWVLTKIPLIQLMAWMFTFEIIKKAE